MLVGGFKVPPKLSLRGDVEPFHAMDVLARANALKSQGHEVLSLAVGQPGTKPPLGVRQAAATAAMENVLGYTNALGRDDTRQAIADHYGEHYNLQIPASRIAVTNGSSAGFSLAFLALTEPSGRIAISSPGYPAYRNIIKSLSLEAVEIPSTGNTDSAFDLDALITQHRQKPIDVLMIASPANPTGSIVSESELKNIIEVCAQEGIAFISDEIYHRLNYVAPDVTAASLSDQAIVINSFSKFYCMTGWRVGWMVLPEQMVRPIERLAQSLYISAPELSQIACIEAFKGTQELEDVRKVYRANRKLLMEKLPKLDMPFASPPDGAFYAWCDVSAHTNDSMSFAKRMLEEIHVAAAPGLDFDTENGARYMRFSYAGEFDVISRALDRMESWIK